MTARFLALVLTCKTDLALNEDTLYIYRIFKMCRMYDNTISVFCFKIEHFTWNKQLHTIRSCRSLHLCVCVLFTVPVMLEEAMEFLENRQVPSLIWIVFLFNFDGRAKNDL